jgi:glycosyltransferase involved in cell wall biosynthesis
MPSTPSVILSIANIQHYYYTALALQRVGYLKRFICSVGYANDSHFKYLPNSWAKRVSRRYYAGIEPSIIKTLPLTEMIPRGLKDSKIISSEQMNWLFSHIYDWVAQQYILPCDYFHYVVPSGLYSGRKAKKQKSVLIADVRTEYFDYQTEILREENESFGFKIKQLGLLDKDKTLAEYQLADYIIVPSKYAKNTFEKAGFDGSKIFIIPYGVDISRFSSSENQIETRNPLANDIFRVLFIGQIVLRKGVHYLIDAFCKLKLPDIELVLIGEIEPEFKDFITDKVKLDTRIKLLGQIPNAELQQYYSSASVFVLPSLADSFGLVSLEAMACELPVIVTENTGSNEAVSEGVNGFIIPIRNAQIIAEKLAWFYEHPDERRMMGIRARESALEYTWEHYGEHIVQFYNKLSRNLN